MDFIKRWIWGEDSQQTQAPEEKIKKETDRQRTVLLQPVLRELPHGAPAPVQGLDWYKNSLLKDADGDCANDFLEEPQKHHMCDSSPALKRPHVASLQSNADKAVPAHIRSLTVERGRVTHSR